MLNRLKQACKRDRLGVLGVASAVGAFVLWAWPSEAYFGVGYCFDGASEWVCVFESHPEIRNPTFLIGPNGWSDKIVVNLVGWFSADRIPIIGALLALTVVLLLLRRR